MTRCGTHRRLAALAVALLAASAAAQEIVLTTGSAGCLAQKPGVVGNLKAVAGDGRVTLSWDRPENGACVKTYLVEVSEVDSGMLRSAPQPRRAQAPDVTVTIDQLSNGVKYRFNVAADSCCGTGPSALVVATPRKPPPPPPKRPDRQLCSRLLPPGQPTDLKATLGPGSINLCWGPPSFPWGCADSYNVTATLLSSQSRTLGMKPLFWDVNSGACVDAQGLMSGGLYEFKVTSWARMFGSSSAAIVQARPL